MMSQASASNTEPTGVSEYLTLAFSPTNAPLHSRWRNNGLSADFLGDYVTTFLPTKDRATGPDNQQNQIKHAVAYIANELLENAMKYHQRDVDIPIRIHLELANDRIAVSVSNGVSAVDAQRYEAFIEHLREGNAEDLLMQQQEESAQSNESEVSSVGLLTMICDYDAQLDWRFDLHPVHSDSVTVTTSAVLMVAGASA